MRLAVTVDRGIATAFGMSLLAHGLAFGLWNDRSPALVEPPQLLEARLVVPEPEPPAAAHPPPVRPPVEPHAAPRPHPPVPATPHVRAPEQIATARPVEREAPPRLTGESSREAPAPAVASGAGTAAAPLAAASAPPAAMAGGGGPAAAYAPPSFGASYLHNPKPAYPLMARRRGLQGLVRLDVKVNAEGIPTAVRVKDSSGHEALDEAALTAVWHWRFAPARRGGEAVEGSVVVPVRFNLDGEAAS